MKTPIRITAALLTVTLLAGCGGASSQDTPAPTSTSSRPATSAAPTPARDYTLKELKAILPSKAEVPGARSLLRSCPKKDSPFCPELDEGAAVSVNFALDFPGSPKGADLERAAAEAFLEDNASIDVWRHKSPAAAQKTMRTAEDAAAVYAGKYSIKEVRKGKYITPREQGTGTNEVLSLDGWEGYISSRSGSFGFQDKTMQRQSVDLRVAQGRITITVNVGADDDGHPAGHAENLARTMLTDYLARLP